jgi:high-affinity Fe2+/Pb2+ permease
MNVAIVTVGASAQALWLASAALLRTAIDFTASGDATAAAIRNSIVVFDLDRYDSAIDTGTERIYVTIDLRVVGGLVGMQVAPTERADHARHQNQQPDDEHSLLLH